MLQQHGRDALFRFFVAELIMACTPPPTDTNKCKYYTQNTTHWTTQQISQVAKGTWCLKILGGPAAWEQTPSLVVPTCFHTLPSTCVHTCFHTYLINYFIHHMWAAKTNRLEKRLKPTHPHTGGTGHVWINYWPCMNVTCTVCLINQSPLFLGDYFKSHNLTSQTRHQSCWALARPKSKMHEWQLDNKKNKSAACPPPGDSALGVLCVFNVCSNNCRKTENRIYTQPMLQWGAPAPPQTPPLSWGSANWYQHTSRVLRRCGLSRCILCMVCASPHPLCIWNLSNLPSFSEFQILVYEK